MYTKHAATIIFTALATCTVSLSTMDRSFAAERMLAVAETKQNAPTDTAPTFAAACEAAWNTADINKNGVIDQNEASVYAAALNSQHKPPAADTRVDRIDALESCESLTAHE
jgi:hypothetical protein